MKSPLVKPKYKNDELIKAVDTGIRELIKQPPLEKNEVKERVLYEELKEEEETLKREIKTRNTQIEQTNERIDVLKETLDSLMIQLDRESMLEDIAMNRLYAYQTKLTDLNELFIQSQQRATQESVDVATIKGTFDGLKAEVNTMVDVRSSLVSTYKNKVNMEVTAEHVSIVSQSSGQALDSVGSLSENIQRVIQNIQNMINNINR